MNDANDRKKTYNEQIMRKTFITKTSGEKELFSGDKLRSSLSRSGADEKLINKVSAYIEKEVERGVLSTTQDLYKHAFKMLRKESRMVASRYYLRRAIMELGPSGHPFENFLARILASDGYATSVGVTVSGACVDHEIDVVAEKNGNSVMIECKFHNQQGIKSDVKTSLYIQARFEDISKKNHSDRAEKGFNEVWLVTNTKLTGDAIRYARCVGMKAIGWSYPSVGNLQDLVEASGLHPVTCLAELNRGQKHYLLNAGIVVCKDILEHPEVLKGFNFSSGKLKKVIAEAETFSCPMKERDTVL
jgi:hypothetical protein